MKKLAVVFCGLLLAALPSTPALADTVYDFSFTGVGISGSGQFTTIAGSPGHELITSISGTTDGQTITGLLAPNAYESNDNLLNVPGLNFDVNGVSYVLANGEWINLYAFPTVPVTDFVFSVLPDTATVNRGGVSLTISLDSSPVPEPSSLLLLGTGVIGLAGSVRRKLLS